MKINERSALAFRKRIQESGLTIYDKVKIGDPHIWIPAPELQTLLLRGLKGTSLRGLPLRTRSKVVKQLVCESLGYPVPTSFRKTYPRFPGQCFDTYVQKSSNLQIWNEELSPTRRYAMIRVSEHDVITSVRVVDGETLSLLDPTGTLTQKYQARIGKVSASSELYTKKDTVSVRRVIKESVLTPQLTDLPTDHPTAKSLLPISTLFKKLEPLLGYTLSEIGRDQERNRGGLLHQMVCKQLGYREYRDTGRFPDVRNQLLEVKLQTSPTIDLGLVTPDATDPLDTPMIDGVQLRHCDVRYGVFCATIKKSKVRLDCLIVVTGEEFFQRFTRFEGKVINRKIQIPLPRDFFERQSE